jgi:hypothetical protein
MARYIDADKFLESQIERCGGVMPIIGTCTMDNEALSWVVEKTPTADVVEVKHGYWIESIHKETPIIKDGRFFEKEHEVFCCSVCDVKIVGLRNMSFCPFCGAKMDGERKCNNG